MRINFFEVDAGDPLIRMMFRANHIYILFCGLLNLLIHFIFKENQKQSLLIHVSSLLVIAATVGVNVAFYIDPVTRSLQRDMTRYSIITFFAGTILYLLILQFRRKE